MLKYIVPIILAVYLLYMIIWTFKLHVYNKRQKKVKRIKELRAKGNEIKKRTIDCTKDYWYNLREVEDCDKDEDFEKYYHYFIGVDQGVHELLIEMYDCGIVRTDELEEIAYGKNHYKNVDLSFLEEFEDELKEEGKIERTSAEVMQEIGEVKREAEDEQILKELKEQEDSGLEDGADEHGTASGKESGAGMDDVIQVQGGLGDFFGSSSKIVEAARRMDKNDPGIKDIKGTLSDGVKDVIRAVDEEKEAKDRMNEPILPKVEKSVEKARKQREMTANAEIRNKIYEKWVSYVFELYELVNINANEDTKHRIRKALMDYGYNDVDVLLEDPQLH